MSHDLLSLLPRAELLSADSFLCCLSSEHDVSSGIFLVHDPPCPNFIRNLYKIHQIQMCVLIIFGFSESLSFGIIARPGVAFRYLLN